MEVNLNFWRAAADGITMKLLAPIFSAALLLTACGGETSSERTVMAVQVRDFGDSTIGGVDVSAELVPEARIGGSTEPIEQLLVTTDGNGVAYFEVLADKNYQFFVEVVVPGEPNCSYRDSAWTPSDSNEVLLVLENKLCV